MSTVFCCTCGEPIHSTYVKLFARYWCAKTLCISQGMTALADNHPRTEPAMPTLANGRPMTGPHGIYVASRVHHWKLWQQQSLIFPIISSWINEPGEGDTPDMGALWDEQIVNEVRASKALIIYVEPQDFPLKGAFIEVGMAMAYGKPIILCAPGVVVEGRSCRPIGSWMCSRLVTREDNLGRAFGRALHQPWT